jgi:quinol monooxygenase YgiN|tara:strand:- start:208 stop:537 length:330 start_codon:yes stop_codon:yes gene_type:complete
MDFFILTTTQEHHMAVGIVATLKIQADKIEAFETDFKALMAIVAEKEPGNNYYDLHKSRDEAGSYVVMEQYVDQAALDLHGKSDEFKAKSAKLGDYLAGAPTVTILDAV